MSDTAFGGSHDELVRSHVESFGGRLVDLAGDDLRRFRSCDLVRLRVPTSGVAAISNAVREFEMRV